MLAMTQTELATLASNGLPARLTGQWVHGKKYYFCRYCAIFMKFRGPEALNDTYKKQGVGAVMVNQTSSGESLLPGPNILRGERRSRASFPLSKMDQSDSDSTRTRPNPSQAPQAAVSLMPRTDHGTRDADHVSPTRIAVILSS